MVTSDCTNASQQIWISYNLNAYILETVGPVVVIILLPFICSYFCLETWGLSMSNACCLSSLTLCLQGSALLWEGAWLCSSCTEGRKVIRNSVSKRMSCGIDPLQRPALTKLMAGTDAPPAARQLGSGQFPEGFTLFPVTWQSVSWLLSGKLKPDTRYLQLVIFYLTRRLLKAIFLEGASFTHSLSRRQTKCPKKFCFFLLNLVVQTWKVNKKLAINNMKSFLTRKESRAALIN